MISTDYRHQRLSNPEMLGQQACENSKHIVLHSEQMGWMDGWFICDFTSFSAVFQSYQDDGTDDDERIFAMEPRLMRGWNPEPQDQ